MGSARNWPKMGPVTATLSPLLSFALSQFSVMAESRDNQTGNEGNGDDDYMGDLSKFLPSEISNPSKSSAGKKVSMCSELLSTLFYYRIMALFTSLWFVLY